MKCPHCGKVPKPIKDENGKINWKNLLLPDLSSILMLVTVLAFLLAFHYADAECSQVRADPCKYCPKMFSDATGWQVEGTDLGVLKINISTTLG